MPARDDSHSQTTLSLQLLAKKLETGRRGFQACRGSLAKFINTGLNWGRLFQFARAVAGMMNNR
jgi:hypothetical protein